MTDDANASLPPIRIEPAERADLPRSLEVQHRAFARVARWLGIDDHSQLPPVAETLEDVERLIDVQGAVVLVARAGGGRDAPIVGTVRGLLSDDGSVEVGRLGVDDGWEGRGIGRALMIAIEEAYPDVGRFELFTGRDAVGPIRLYESLGYRIVRDEEVRPDLFLVWLEKCRGRRVDSGA
jgi:ribosomal protein S18 acetylase RimI-like enzyme